jgi:hypothetical protein
MCIAWHSFSLLHGSIKIAASPTTSGNEEVFEAITGAPQAIASSGGSPNPS